MVGGKLLWPPCLPYCERRPGRYTTSLRAVLCKQLGGLGRIHESVNELNYMRSMVHWVDMLVKVHVCVCLARASAGQSDLQCELASIHPHVRKLHAVQPDGELLTTNSAH